jgi:hypothetical protein
MDLCVCVFFKKNSHLAPKALIESQENLAKSGYKTNREIKKINLGILLHVGESLEPIN